MKPFVFLTVLFTMPLFGDEVAKLRQTFIHPPPDARINMRWWWFGPAVSKPELKRELEVMRQAGIGGVEIQPVYPLELDDPEHGIRNAPYLSPEFLDDLGFTAETAERLGLRVDVTLGSGWPYGGPATPVTEAAPRLKCERVELRPNEQSVAVPALENGESLIAVFLAQGDRHYVSAQGAQRLTDIQNGRVQVGQPGAGSKKTVLFFISSRTGQQVKRASVGAEGFVLDHYNRAAVEHHLEHVAEKLLTAFKNHPPYSVFSDSLEVFGSDWTADFLGEFQKRRGYDLEPHLPHLAADDVTPESAAIRHDWAKTLTELAEERYLTPIREWARKHRTQFRSQTYGEPPAVLSSNALVDLPEGEAGPHWRTFSTARWAASASHLYQRPVTSTETWTWLHSPAFRATPLDMKAEADLHFLQGINQLIGHGWPYSPERAGEPGQRFYAAAAFNEHNPWFQVMPDIAAYLQRVSFVLRQGKPANDIAVYLPTDDAWANTKLGKISVDRQMGALLGPTLVAAILDAGYNLDFIDDRAIEQVGIPYKLLLIPGVERMPEDTLRRLAAYRSRGGLLVAVNRLPSIAPGFQNGQSPSAEVSALAKQLFSSGNSGAKFLADEGNLGRELNALLPPDFAVDHAVAPAIGFVHRKLENADVYFVANTSNRRVRTSAKLRTKARGAELWNAFTGGVEPLFIRGDQNSASVELNLAPYESEVIVLSDELREAPAPQEQSVAKAVDLSREWTVTFARNGRVIRMDQFRSWTEDEADRFYSGEATYERGFELDTAPKAVMLDFGPGEPIPAPPATGAPGMRALLESPVRESAVVFVNGQRAGSVWHPPYQLDISKFVHAGRNQLRVTVANTAINEIAGRSLPDYRLLNLRYGERFTPQGFEHIEPLPSGILGKVQVLVR